MDLPSGPANLSVCYFEEPVQITDIVPQLQRCLCGPASAPAQYVYSIIRVLGTCGTSVSSAMQFPKGFVSMSIGSWTLPGSYPGEEDLRWNMGGYRYDDCTGITAGEVFYGVTTMNGYPALQLLTSGVGTTLPLTFVDQGNSVRYPTYTTTMNVPYLTNHILNLNY
jgi:hypothetical protein